MRGMSFALDNHRLPYCKADDDRLQRLGNWLITDVSVYKRVCLDALATVADLGAGEETEPWESEHYTVSFLPAAVRVQSDWVESEHGEFSLDEFREAVEAYWQFLVSIPDNPDVVREFRPELPGWQAAILQWEDTWKRPHPYRGKLF